MLQIHHFWFLRLVENKQKKKSNIKLARPNIKLLKLDAVVPNTGKEVLALLYVARQRGARDSR